MTIDAWPSDLPTGVVCFYPVGGGRSAGGAFMSPPASGASTYGPRWTAKVEQLPLLKRDTLLAARALQARLENGGRPVMLEACVGQLSPQVAGGTTMEAVVGADVEAGDDQLQILLAGSFHNLRGGELFSATHDDANVGRRLYLVVELIDNADPAAPTVRIVPALRGDLAADAVLDFATPSCPMRLVDGFDLPTEAGRFSAVEALFEEWFDASPTRQIANLRDLTLSPATIQEASPEDTFVGRLFGMSSGSTVTLTGTAGGRFKLVDDAGALKIFAGATATDFGTATSHDITVREALAGRPNTPHDTVLTIQVTEVVVSGPAPHRAYRLNSFASSNATYTGLASIRFMANGVDVTSLGTVSSFGSGADVLGSEAAKAIDGNPATSAIRTSPTNCGLLIDFGAVEANWIAVDDILATVHSGDNTYGPFSASFDYTDDDPASASWTLINNVTFGNTWLYTVERSATETIPTDGSYRCQRLRVLTHWGSPILMLIEETEMRVSGVDILPAGHSNDSLIRQIASADNSGSHPASDAWNNLNNNTPWEPGLGLTDGQWMGAIFPAPVKPDGVFVRNLGISLDVKTVAYEGSHDNSTWTLIANSGTIPNTAALHQIYP